jgi:hypothetical protein
MRHSAFFSWLLVVSCGVGALVACSGGDSAENTSSGDGIGGKGGKGGKGGSSTGGGGTGGGGAGGSVAVGGEGGVSVGQGGSSAEKKLSILPAEATVTISAKGTPAQQPFQAFVEGESKPVPVVWSLSNYSFGSIDKAGLFTSAGIVAGTLEVQAKYGAQVAKATLAVKVALSEVLQQDPSDPGPSAPNSAALDGPPGAEAGDPTKVLYPYDGTVFPLGLTTPLVQFSPGSLPPEDAKLALTSPQFSWEGKVKVQDPNRPQVRLPQDIWDAALRSAAGQKLTLSITKASGGKAYGPAQIGLIAATANLKGAVYYMTYHEPVGLYSVRPGIKEPAKQIVQGCVVCHSVAANGTRLSTGAEVDPNAPDYAKSGVYAVGSDGSANQLSPSPEGLGVGPGSDSRGLSFAAWTPDGRYVFRDRDRFWGGTNPRAWHVDDATGALLPATVAGLEGQSVLLPTFSPDGKRFAFTNGPNGTHPGTPGRSVVVADLSLDPSSHTLQFLNLQTAFDNGPGGPVSKYGTFLPDSNLLVLQEGEGYQSSYDEMLPTWDPNSTYKGSTGRLHLARLDTKEHLELAAANKGNTPADQQRNYEPFSLPLAAGGYYWVVFTSIREYGNTYQGDQVRKQLWVTAISTNAPAGQDPSHPPFYLPSQTDTPNERGFWALEPCKSDGKSCETGDECCGGFCRPSDVNDPTSPKACQASGGDVPGNQCAQVSEKCTKTADCCEATGKIQCINGFCSESTPQVQ